jgi:hypothetical protein
MARKNQFTNAMAWIESQVDQGRKLIWIAEQLHCTAAQVSRFRFGDRPVGNKHQGAFVRLSGIDPSAVNLPSGEAPRPRKEPKRVTGHTHPAKVLADRRRAERRDSRPPKTRKGKPKPVALPERPGAENGRPLLTTARVMVALSAGLTPGPAWADFLHQLERGSLDVDRKWSEWCSSEQARRTAWDAQGAEIGSDPPQEGSPSQSAASVPSEAAARAPALYDHLKFMERRSFKAPPAPGVVVLNLPKDSDQPEAK